MNPCSLLAIDEMLFREAFDRDVQFHDARPQSAYLDRASGEILWAYEEDEDAYIFSGVALAENAAIRQRVAAAPHRYLQIPGLDHGEHHEILKDFLDSPWTEDEELRTRALQAYSDSIGRWKRAVSYETDQEFCDFRQERTKQMAEDFLRRNGIEPQWK